MGRPTTLTAAIQSDIVELVRQGNHLASAARACGVPDSTLRGWMAAPGARFRRFRDEIAAAEAQAEAEAVGQVRIADRKWWLERRHPERWGRPSEPRAQAAAVLQVGMAPDADAAPEAEVLYFTPEELRIASRAFLNQKRVLRGEPPLLEDPAQALRGLIVEGSEGDGGAD